MDSPTGIGAMIFEAAGNGNLEKLNEIKGWVGDVREYRRICDVYSDSNTGMRALNVAAEIGHLEICQFLIDTIGVQIDVITYKGDTPLIGAARENNVEIVEYLVSQDAQVQVANSKGFTALHYAVLNGNIQLIEFLGSNEAPLDADSIDGTPLHCAASRGSTEALGYLLVHGAKPNSTNLFCDTPLICAIKSHSFDCVNLLLMCGADSNKHLYGLTPLALAAKDSDTRYLSRLLQAGAQPNNRSTGFVKPIVEAALVNNVEGVKILFPLTTKIPEYLNWTVEGIMAFANSLEAKVQREGRWTTYLESLDGLGKKAVRSKNYKLAIKWYSEARFLNPFDVKWIELRSMCSARLGNCVDALHDAEECARLNAHTARQIDPHYRRLKREGEADPQTPTWKLFQRYHMSSLDFILAPRVQNNQKAFRSALFEYFSYLYLMNSPEETANFIKYFL